MPRLVLRVGCWWGRGPGWPRANKQHEFGRQDRSVQGKGRRDTCAVIRGRNTYSPERGHSLLGNAREHLGPGAGREGPWRTGTPFRLSLKTVQT